MNGKRAKLVRKVAGEQSEGLPYESYEVAREKQKVFLVGLERKVLTLRTIRLGNCFKGKVRELKRIHKELT